MMCSTFISQYVLYTSIIPNPNLTLTALSYYIRKQNNRSKVLKAPVCVCVSYVNMTELVIRQQVRENPERPR